MPELDQAGDTFHQDLEIVRSLSPPAREPGPPGLVILYGLPASGKSHFANLLAERCRAVALNSDAHRRAIITGPPRYDGPENRRLFDALNRRAEELLDQGQIVVFDSTALRTWIRQPLETMAQERRLTPVRVHLNPSETIIYARLDARQPPPDPANNAKTWRDVYHWMAPAWEPIAEPHLQVVDPKSVNDAIETVRRLLAGDIPPPT